MEGDVDFTNSRGDIDMDDANDLVQGLKTLAIQLVKNNTYEYLHIIPLNTSGVSYFTHMYPPR